MKKITLFVLLMCSLTAYGNPSKDINIIAAFVEPLKVTLSSQDLTGKGLRGVAGIKKLDPILIEFSGEPNSKVKFSVEKKITLIGDSGDNLILTTTIKGSDVSYTGAQHESRLVLTAEEKFQSVELGGDLHLTGKERSKEYLGIINVIIIQD